MDTVVLNFSWKPLGIVNWKKAITIWSLGKSEIVDTYDEEIRSPKICIKKPRVIRLLYNVPIRFNHATARLTKKNIYYRDNGKCGYCEKKIKLNEMTIDHIIPRYYGGKHIWENVVVCCDRCNNKKGNKRLEDIEFMDLRTKIYAPSMASLINESKRFLEELDYNKLVSIRYNQGAVSIENHY